LRAVGLEVAPNLAAGVKPWTATADKRTREVESFMLNVLYYLCCNKNQKLYDRLLQKNPHTTYQ